MGPPPHLALPTHQVESADVTSSREQSETWRRDRPFLCKLKCHVCLEIPQTIEIELRYIVGCGSREKVAFTAGWVGLKKRAFATAVTAKKYQGGWQVLKMRPHTVCG